MKDCKHESLTIDRYCNNCGRDLIVDDREDLIRQREQERIIKLLEEWFADGDNYQEPTSKLIALIKGEN